MPNLFTNRIAWVQLTAMAAAASAGCNMIPTGGVDETRLSAAILLTSSAISAAMRFRAPGEAGSDSKSWWQSRTIWTQIVGATCAILALAGIVPGADQGALVDVVMAIVGVATMLLGCTVHRRIEAPGAVIAGTVFAISGMIAALVMIGGCATSAGRTGSAIAGHLAEATVAEAIANVDRRIDRGAISPGAGAAEALRRLEASYAAVALGRALFDGSHGQSEIIKLTVARQMTDQAYAAVRTRLEALSRQSAADPLEPGLRSTLIAH